MSTRGDCRCCSSIWLMSKSCLSAERTNTTQGRVNAPIPDLARVPPRSREPLRNPRTAGDQGKCPKVRVHRREPHESFRTSSRLRRSRDCILPGAEITATDRRCYRCLFCCQAAPISDAERSRWVKARLSGCSSLQRRAFKMCPTRMRRLCFEKVYQYAKIFWIVLV